jgi:hypothetical protein
LLCKTPHLPGHFAFSDDLAVAGLLTRDTCYREAAEQLTAGHPPAGAIDLIFETIPEHARARLSRIAGSSTWPPSAQTPSRRWAA